MNRRKLSQEAYCTCKECGVERGENKLVVLAVLSVAIVLILALWR